MNDDSRNPVLTADSTKAVKSGPPEREKNNPQLLDNKKVPNIRTTNPSMSSIEKHKLSSA